MHACSLKAAGLWWKPKHGLPRGCNSCAVQSGAQLQAHSQLTRERRTLSGAVTAPYCARISSMDSWTARSSLCVAGLASAPVFAAPLAHPHQHDGRPALAVKPRCAPLEAPAERGMRPCAQRWLSSLPSALASIPAGPNDQSRAERAPQRKRCTEVTYTCPAGTTRTPCAIERFESVLGPDARLRVAGCRDLHAARGASQPTSTLHTSRKVHLDVCDRQSRGGFAARCSAVALGKPRHSVAWRARTVTPLSSSRLQSRRIALTWHKRGSASNLGF